ncbi:hypothetical protein Tco_0155829 [Tanacetum coccineum]
MTWQCYWTVLEKEKDESPVNDSFDYRTPRIMEKEFDESAATGLIYQMKGRLMDPNQWISSSKTTKPTDTVKASKNDLETLKVRKEVVKKGVLWWMFPFERYMKKLKNYVRNKAKPKGSIAEGYVAEEALTFCSRYLKDDVETRFNRLGRNDDGLPEEEPNKF